MNGKQLEIRFDEIEALEAEITAHQDAYQAGKPTISDADYDKLVAKLEIIKPTSKALERIGNADGKVAHEIPMLSLQKAYDIEALYDWACRYEAKRCIVSMKLDGIACSLVYRHGKLIQASTRGNGLQGMDITANILNALRIPQSIRQRDMIEVRGELILTKADIADLGIKVGRSAVAGAVAGKVSEITRRLQLVAYDIAGNAHHEAAKWRKLAHLGFELPKHARITWEEIEDAVEGFDGLRESYHYETDGIVFKIEDAHKFAECGFTKHHPKGAIAYKWPQMASESILEPQTCENTSDDENAHTAQNTANSGHLTEEKEMTVLRFEDVSRHLEVAETQEHDDGMTWTLTSGGKIRLTWGYAVGNQLGCHNHHNTFAMWECEDEDGELVESFGVDVDPSDYPVTPALWVIFEVRAVSMLADSQWLADMGWRTGGGKLYVCMNEGPLEEFDGFTDLTQVKRFWSAHIAERGSYMHRLTKGACQLAKGDYEWEWCTGWRSLGGGLPEWVCFNEDD